jgi:flagellin-like hook-associated protein FlgL
MFRVTNSMMVNTLMMDLQTNLRALTKYNEQLQTTKMINRPSDNPGGLVKSLRLRTNLNEVAQYSSNINEAVNYMRTTDAALDNIDQIMHRIRELVVDVSNEAKSPSDMQMIGKEISELRDQVVMIANTAYGTKMVFAGRNVTESPRQPDGTWVGNDESLYVEIGVGNITPINVTNRDMNNFFTGEKVNLMSIDFLDKTNYPANYKMPMTDDYTLTIRYRNQDGSPGATAITLTPPAVPLGVTPGYVDVNTAGTLYTEPNSSAVAGAAVAAGDRLTVVARSGDWYQVQTAGGDSGFIAVADVDSVPQFATVEDLNEALGLALYNNADLAAAELKVSSRVQDGHLIISSNNERLTRVEDSVSPDAYSDTDPFSIFTLIDKIVYDINNADARTCSSDLALIDIKFQDMLTSRSILGARINRLDLQLTRLDDNEVSYTDLLSQNEDADMTRVIMELKTQENIYRAALGSGARIIQPTLVDFLN